MKYGDGPQPRQRAAAYGVVYYQPRQGLAVPDKPLFISALSAEVLIAFYYYCPEVLAARHISEAAPRAGEARRSLGVCSKEAAQRKPHIPGGACAYDHAVRAVLFTDILYNIAAGKAVHPGYGEYADSIAVHINRTAPAFIPALYHQPRYAQRGQLLGHIPGYAGYRKAIVRPGGYCGPGSAGYVAAGEQTGNYNECVVG